MGNNLQIREKLTKEDICGYNLILLVAYIKKIEYLRSSINRRLLYVWSNEDDELITILANNELLINQCINDRNNI